MTWDPSDDPTEVTIESANPQEAIESARDVITGWLRRGWTVENELTLRRALHSLELKFTASTREPTRVLTVVGCMNFGEDDEQTTAAIKIIEIATHGIEPWMERARQQITSPSDKPELRVMLTTEW